MTKPTSAWFIRYTNRLTGTREVSRIFRSKETAEREFAKPIYRARDAQLVRSDGGEKP